MCATVGRTQAPCSCGEGVGYPSQVPGWAAAPLPLSPSAVIKQEVHSEPSRSKYKNSKCTRAVFQPHKRRLPGRKPAADLPLDSQHAGWGSAPSWPCSSQRCFLQTQEWESPEFPFPGNPKGTESKVSGLVDRTSVRGPFVGDGPLLLVHLGHTRNQPPLHSCQMQQRSLLSWGFSMSCVYALLPRTTSSNTTRLKSTLVPAGWFPREASANRR